MSSARVVIFANGLLPDLEKARALVSPDDIIVCADGGTRHALDLGLIPAALIGDLDSLAAVDRTRISGGATRVLEHSPDKDSTDLELALRYALELKPAAIVVVGALGGRVDQTLANISVLAEPMLANLDVKLDDGVEEVFFCRDRAEIRGSAGDIISLIPWGAAVAGVRTDRLRWSLNGETLYPDRSRGISNEMLDISAEVHIESGLLLIVHRRQP